MMLSVVHQTVVNNLAGAASLYTHCRHLYTALKWDDLQLTYAVYTACTQTMRYRSFVYTRCTISIMLTTVQQTVVNNLA